MADDNGAPAEKGSLRSKFMKVAKWAVVGAATFSFGLVAGHAIAEAMAHHQLWYGFYTGWVNHGLEPVFSAVGEALIALTAPFGLDFVFTTPPPLPTLD